MSKKTKTNGVDVEALAAKTANLNIL